MQINMQAVLSQPELEDAIREYVKAQIPLQGDPAITVTFEDDAEGNLTAIVVIEKGGVAEDKPKETKTRSRKPAAAANPALVEAANEAKALNATEEEAKLNISAGTEDREEPVVEKDEPPFEVEDSTAKEDAKAEAQAVANEKEAPKTPSIFPSTLSSAPAAASNTAPNGAPTTSPTSLFANLKKPTN